MAESTKTFTDQIKFWHWGKLFALTNLVDSARHYCLELILKGKTKLKCNKELQSKFNVNKRWAGSIYTEVQGIVSNIDENKTNHIKLLSSQIKSIKTDIIKREKQIKDFAKQENNLRKARSQKGFSAIKLKIKKACNINTIQRQTTQLQDANTNLI